MARIGLVGASYNSQSPTADGERSVNWYPETIESGMGKSAVALYPSEGLSTFATIDIPVRGQYTYQAQTAASLKRTFAVGGSSFYEINQDGTKTKYGAVINDGLPVTFAANQANQLLFTSGGVVYLFDMVALGAISKPAGLLGTVVQVAFCHGYFLALLSDGRMQISTLLDGSSWPGLQVVQVSVYGDRPISMKVDHSEVWLWSATRGVVYYNSGSSSIFDPIGASAELESGIGSAASAVLADNTLFWIEASERGGGIARRAQQYTPVRVSNHAVEYQWSTYPTIADAIGWSTVSQGHTWVWWFFPSANNGLGATWCLDVESGWWSERLFWDAPNGQYTAHRSQNQTFNFGKTLVGDWNSGRIYDMSLKYNDDFGQPIRRMRITPPVSAENEWIYGERLQIDLEAGLALQSGQGSAPKALLSWTKDGGHTFSDEQVMNAGLVGQYRQRMYFNRLGRWRQCSFKLVVSDPIPWRIIEGDLLASDGNGRQIFGPSERIAKQYSKAG